MLFAIANMHGGVWDEWCDEWQSALTAQCGRLILPSCLYPQPAAFPSGSFSASLPHSVSSRRSRPSISSRPSPTSPRAFGLLLTLNLGYWYSWAALTPGILCLTRRFPFDRATWKMAIPIHVAGVVLATSLHVVLTVALHMGTYWLDRRVDRRVAPRGAGDAHPELRLGNDDLLDDRRRRHGAALSPRGARARN